MSRHVGVREVAARAGVSMGTVSNVLNGVRRVSPENVARVGQAIDELGFVPNAHARHLRGGRSDTVGMVVLNIGNPFFSDVAHSAHQIAQDLGFQVVISSSAQDEASEARFLSMFEESRVRGLLVAPVHGITPRLEDIRRRGTPVVLLGEAIHSEQFCAVSLDGEAGGAMAVEHLLEAGRKRIAFVGGPIAQVASRLAGATRAIDDGGGATLSMVGVSDLTIADGLEAARRIWALDARDRPDGIFAANDLVALGMLTEFQARGISVPDDIALVGYDDIDFARTASVPLTSISQPRAMIAAEAMRLLVAEDSDLSGNAHSHEQVRLAPTLIVRQSTTG